MRKALFIVAFLFAASVAWGQSGGKPATYMVFKGETPVLQVVDKPGIVLSTALPPPGWKPPKHPFLTASASKPSEEHRLKQILDASTSTADFLRKLEEAGYRVRRK